MKKVLSLLLAVSVLFCLASCGKNDTKTDLQPLRIGIVKGSAQVERDVFDNMTSRLEKAGYQLTYVEFDTEAETLTALTEKQLEFTCCTTLADFRAYDEAHPDTLVNLGSAYYYPYGVFLSGFEKAEQVTDGATIAVPSEPEGQARALMLLDAAGYIKLKQGKALDATLDDIEQNDRDFAISAYPESELPARYKDFSSDLIVMHSKTAADAGYAVDKYSIAIEGMGSIAARETAAVLLVNREEAASERITAAKNLFFSPLMYDLIDDYPSGVIVPAFEISPMKLASPTNEAKG